MGFSLEICLFWTFHIIHGLWWPASKTHWVALCSGLFHAFPQQGPFTPSRHPLPPGSARLISSPPSDPQFRSRGSPPRHPISNSNPSLQPCLSPSLLYFVHRTYHHTYIRLIYPVSRSSSRSAFCLFTHYCVSSTYSSAWQHSGNSLNICWMGEWAVSSIPERSTSIELIFLIILSAYYVSGIGLL